MFEHPTFIVLDMPSPVADKVQKLHDRFDPVVAGFPIEITVVGSSGIKAIITTEIRFDESLFPYIPHCTIRSVGKVSDYQ